MVLEETPGLFADFLSIYRHTLTRNQADGFYYFKDRFYEAIHKGLQGNFLYAHTLKEGQVISTELLLYNQTYLHSFLGGTLENFYEYRPNNVLKHEIILWAKRKGIRYFLLGGGYREGDGIFRYKRSFAPRGVMDFWIGKKIHDQKTVAMLEQGLPQKKEDDSQGYFPSYRRY